jgi:hypothetical protein
LALLLPYLYLTRGRDFGNLTYRGERVEVWFNRLPVAILSAGKPTVVTAMSLTTFGQEFGGDGTAIDAFQSFGSNSIPFLLEKLRSRDSALETAAKTVAAKMRQPYLPFRIAEVERGQAVIGLINLKSLPDAAMHELVLLGNNAAPETAWAALHVLKEVAPEEAKKVRRERW